jgi:RNA polymerase sigma-70 factor (ECF subfamily)
MGAMPKDPQTEFLELHLAHQRALFGYILAAVRDFQRAEDLLQQVTLILWKKFDGYRRDSPFHPWAMGVARNELLHFFRSRKESTIPLEMLDEVTGVLADEEDALSEESRALADCVKSLPEGDRSLLRSRYEEGTSLARLAARIRQTLAAVNMRLVRIRKTLLDCAERSMAGGA